MQETWVRSLIWQDPTFCRAAKPLHHNYWAPEPGRRNYEAHVLQLLQPLHPRAHAQQQERALQ